MLLEEPKGETEALLRETACPLPLDSRSSCVGVKKLAELVVALELTVLEVRDATKVSVEPVGVRTRGVRELEVLDCEGVLRRPLTLARNSASAPKAPRSRPLRYIVVDGVGAVGMLDVVDAVDDGPVPCLLGGCAIFSP